MSLAKQSAITAQESHEGLVEAHKSLKRRINTPGGSSNKKLKRLVKGVEKNIADPDHPGKTASLAKQAAEQAIPQELRRILTNDQPMPVSPEVADKALVRILRSRIRYNQDGSPVTKHGRMILRELGAQL